MTRTPLPFASLLAACLLLVAAAAPQAQTVAAARVLFSKGEVIARGSPAGTRAVQRGDSIYPRDTVLVAAGRAQLRFTDGALVSLKAHTEFRVDEYRYAGSADGTERGYFSLLKGGLRTVTGAIGRINRRSYQVDAQVTTIGIRGTAYSATLCQADCILPDGTRRDDGLYASVTDGTIFLANNAAVLDVPAGHTAFVPDLDTAPRLTDPAPALESLPQTGTSPVFRAGEQRESMEPEIMQPIQPPAPVYNPPP